MLSYKYKEDDVLEVGIDEAGRGSLFGRLYTGAVIFPFDKDDIFDHGAELQQIKDSKKLTKRRRDILYDYVKEVALDWASGYAEPAEIDEINILQASILAMHLAVDKLIRLPQILLIDGNRFKPYPGIPHQCIVKGDEKFLSIAAASVLAKTHRDEFMYGIHQQYPVYGWTQNKGYPSQKHRDMISKYGTTPYHRMTFRMNGKPVT